MTQAIVDLYADGEAAAVRAHRLVELGWNVVLSGPDEGVDLQVGGGVPTPYDQIWVVLASKEAITQVD